MENSLLCSTANQLQRKMFFKHCHQVKVGHKDKDKVQSVSCLTNQSQSVKFNTLERKERKEVFNKIMGQVSML